MTTRELSRREYLQEMTAAGLATLANGAPRLRAEPVAHPKPTADTCILLWMAGGMAAPDTFDPKRYTPFEVGVPVGQDPLHVPGHRHRRGQHQDHRRAWRTSRR